MNTLMLLAATVGGDPTPQLVIVNHCQTYKVTNHCLKSPDITVTNRLPNVGQCSCHNGGGQCYCSPASICPNGCPANRTNGVAPTSTIQPTYMLPNYSYQSCPGGVCPVPQRRGFGIFRR